MNSAEYLGRHSADTLRLEGVLYSRDRVVEDAQVTYDCTSENALITTVTDGDYELIMLFRPGKYKPQRGWIRETSTYDVRRVLMRSLPEMVDYMLQIIFDPRV